MADSEVVAPTVIPALPQQDGSVDSAQSVLAGLLDSGRLKSIRDDDDDEPAPQPSALVAAEKTPAEEATQEPEMPKEAPKTAPEAQKPAPQQAVSSPELDQRLQAATQKEREAEAARNQYVTALNTLVPRLEAKIAGEFADIKDFDDLRLLARNDPGRFNDFVLANAELQQAQNAQAEAQRQQMADNRVKFEQFQEAELKKLPDLIPDLADPEKAPAVAKRIQDYAKAQGYTAQQLAMASANDFKILHRAMMADEYEANQKSQAEESKKLQAEAQRKAAGAPKVQTPGTQQPDNKGTQVQDSFRRLQKSGRVEDAASIFKQMLQ